MEKITLIIPTYNRPDFLRRILAYYADKSLKYKIIVVDSSSDENREKNKEIIGFFHNLSVDFYHYQSDVHPNDKIFRVLGNVSSEYCVICADDDFITLKGIESAMSFLEKNPDFTCVHGNYLQFRLRNDRNKQPKFFWKELYSCKSLTSEDPVERIQHYFPDCCPTFYAVHRTSFLSIIFKEYMDHDLGGAFGELLLSSLTLAHGKVKCMDSIYAFRDKGNLPEPCKLEYFHNVKDYLENGTYLEKHSMFQNCLVRHLSKNSKLSGDELKKILDDSMSSYIKRYHENTPQKILYFMNYFRFPLGIIQMARKIYGRVFIPMKSEIPESTYHDDTREIKKYVIKYAVSTYSEDTLNTVRTTKNPAQ